MLLNEATVWVLLTDLFAQKNQNDTINLVKKHYVYLKNLIMFRTNIGYVW